VPIDRNVVGRIGEHELGFGVAEKLRVGRRVSRVAAEQAMRSQHPQIAQTTDGRTSPILRRFILRPAGETGRLTRLVKDEVNDGSFESSEFDREIEVNQSLQFDGQKLPIPSGHLGKPVIGQNIGSLFGVAEMGQLHCGHALNAKQLCGLDPAMPGNDLLLIVNENRIVEAESLDAVRNLADLLLGVRPRIACVGTEHFYRNHRDLHCKYFPFHRCS
jgi:hypothetical protein